MRFPPKPLTGIIVFLLYLAVFYGVWIINGIDYIHIGDNSDTVLKWYVAPLAAGAVLLIVAVTILGWWKPVLFDTPRNAPRWLIVAPIVMFLVPVFHLMNRNYEGTSATLFWLVVLGSIGVGFCEEMATRGVLLTGFRARFSEPMVWFLSSLLFGLLHLPNWAFGVGPAAMAQVVLAFMTGTMLYLARRATGTLLVPMFLHGLWDFSQFIGKPNGSSLPFLLTMGHAVLAVVLVFLLLRHERGKRLA